MPLSIPRLRTWFAGLALATVAVVAGFYFFARYQASKAVKEVPKKLGVDIQQSTEGFSLSKSEGGRTLFTIHANKAVQYKQGGRARLDDVNIVVYGRKSNRFDQIYGSGFEYDPQAGTIRATGEVQIELEANAEGQVAPDQTPPSESKNPIHLKTSGLVFNQKTGFAETDEPIEFRVPQASGSAVGATYDSKSNLLTLKSNVNIVTTGDRSTKIQAASGKITKDPREMVLNDVHLEQVGRTIQATLVAVQFLPNNNIDHVTATGDVRLLDTSGNGVSVLAPKADLEVGGKNQIRQAVFSGGVQIDGKGDRPIRGNAGKIVLQFGDNSRLSHIRASGDVHLVQAQAGKQESFELFSQTLDATVKDGKTLEVAETSGPARLVLGQGPSDNTVVTAGKFRADFDERSRLRSVRGEPNARVVSSVAGQQDKVSTSRTLLVQFNPGGGLYSITQEGNFRYTEAASAPGAKGAELGGRTATAAKARYNPDDETLALSGSPRVTDGGLSITANSIRINRRSGDAFAEGDVKTTYSELKTNPNGALLATSDPVHVTAKSMSAQRKSGVARYTGGARLWQGSNIVEAPTIEFNQQQRSIVAQGARTQPVSSVFVQAEKNGKATPVVVTASSLEYVDERRTAHFGGGVVAKGADVTISAKSVDVVLHATGKRTAGVTGPSQLSEIVANGDVIIQQPNRRATGEKLVYSAENGSFVLTGGPPLISDAERGTIRGDSLTFYTRDDRIVVDSKEASRTVTRTRVVR